MFSNKKLFPYIASKSCQHAQSQRVSLHLSDFTLLLRSQQPNNLVADFRKARGNFGEAAAERSLCGFAGCECPALSAAVLQPLLLLSGAFAWSWEPHTAQLRSLSMARRRLRSRRSQTPADLGAHTCSRSLLLSKPFISAEEGAGAAQRRSHLEGSLFGFYCC